MLQEEESLITRSEAGAGLSTPAVIGMVVAACLALISIALLILLLCYCFCRSRKYEYNTGNEYRYTNLIELDVTIGKNILHECMIV